MDRLFFRFVTIHAFDRETDRRTDKQTYRIPIVRPRLHSIQRGKNTARMYNPATLCAAGMQARISHEKDVGLSVRLPNAWIVTKRKFCPNFYTT